MDPFQRRRPPGGILLLGFALLLTVAAVVVAFVPLVDCPAPGAFLTGTLEHEGRMIDNPHVAFLDLDHPTRYTAPCPRCKGTSKVTLVNKWFGKNRQPVPPR